MADSNEYEFDALLRQVETLAATPNPESTPYESHYQSIEILNKWLSTDLQPFERAIANAKLGATYLHVEEPHNAQPALETAAECVCPELLAYATTKAPPSLSATPPVPTKTEIQELLAHLPTVRLANDVSKPTHARLVVELLNQCGILWFNRSLPLRALCYFKACAELCAFLETPSTSATVAAGDVDANEELQDGGEAQWLVALRTHAYFYLAQVYGALQLADESALYCLATLELQLKSYTSSSTHGSSEVHEWIKNALRLVDYYTETENGKQASLCLRACEYLLQLHLHVEGEGDDQMGAEWDAVTSDERDQRRAEMYVAWARLHQQTLQLAQLHREGMAPPQPRRVEYVDNVVRRVSLEQLLHDSTSTTDATTATGLRMTFIPHDLVKSYDDARDVFKIGAAACDAALRVFVLDGFVTAHIELVQLHSTLYRRLVSWESELKRQIAMHLRRLALLTPLLGDVISKRAYCAKLQELYYESAEIAVEIYDLKQFKQRPTRGGLGSDVDLKTTAYLLKAIHWYQQYLFLFYASDGSDADTAILARITGDQDKMIVGGTKIGLPATALSSSEGMSPSEFKSVLLGFFSLARACSKVVLPKDHDKTVVLWQKAMAYHEAVLTLVKKYQQVPPLANGTRLQELFQTEIGICEEMLELLPEKINQLVYNGKAL